MRRLAVFVLLLIVLLSYVSCKKKASVLVDQGDSEVSESSSVTVGIAPNSLSEDQFDNALRNMSTAPNYVLLSISDGNSELPEVVSLTATDLVNAISIERELDGMDAMEFALKQPGRVYQFSNPKVIKRLSRNYTESMLSDARLIFAGMTLEEIEAAIRLYSRAPNGKPNYAALAHALTERGILSVKGCLGEFRLDSRKTQHLAR